MLHTIPEDSKAGSPVIPALESKFVTLDDGVTVHYQEAGPTGAPPLILTHGFINSLEAWRFNTAPLAELARERGIPRRIIALDWVGFGRSSKPELKFSLFYFADFLKKFMDALGLSQADLVGHSMGGKHNLAFTILYPHYLRKLVLVDTDGFLADPWYTNYTTAFWFKPVGNLTTVLLGNERMLKAMLKNIVFDLKFAPSADEIKQTARELRDPDYIQAIRRLNRDYPRLSLRLTGLRARLGEITAPVQIFWGLQDRILHIDQGHAAQQEIPGASLYVFDRCGHFPQVEHAAEFNRRVLDFLDK